MKINIQQLNSTKEFVNWIRRQLGYPVVKVELTDQQIIDNIISALNLFLLYASGQATEEAYYTLMLRRRRYWI